MTKLTEERIKELAHRRATKYTHRTTPGEVAYGFIDMHLIDFVRDIEAELQPVQEPCDMGEMCIGCSPRNADGSCPDAAQAEKQEPAKDEPVAWRFSKGTITKLDSCRHGGNWQPLYTRPQPDLTAEVERLHQVCRDAYEVWAGSDGIPEPITCVEAYLLQLLIQMRDEVKRGLK